MRREPNSLRFICLVSVFVGRILILINATSPFILVLGWDGLGVRSYFLVVYYENYKARGAGSTTLLRNRVGDVFIVLLFLTLAASSVNLPYTIAPNHTPVLPLLSLLVLLAAITKSAIFPYRT